jgi:hypothetical protein
MPEDEGECYQTAIFIQEEDYRIKSRILKHQFEIKKRDKSIVCYQKYCLLCKDVKVITQDKIYILPNLSIIKFI